MIDRVVSSMFHWYRLTGAASPGAHLVEEDGVMAAVVPAAPERAVVNAVVYRDADALEAAYDDVASAYAEIGAKWTVWVPPGDSAAASVLEARGHVLDAEPMAMALELDGRFERPPEDDAFEWTAGGTAAEVAAVNDRSYTFGTDSFARALQSLPEEVHVYMAREGGRPIGSVLMTDHEGNSEVQLVAVVPEARGRGITKRLLARALADAAGRGNETSTLIATPMGFPVYESVGFRPLDRFQMWEFRPDA